MPGPRKHKQDRTSFLIAVGLHVVLIGGVARANPRSKIVPAS
jgi:hypothetical protein